MSCRTVDSPLTKKEEISQTWNDLRKLVATDEQADALYSDLTTSDFVSFFGDWVGGNNRKVMVIRHAITQEDIDGKISGNNGIPITAEGRKATEKEAEKIKEAGIEQIYTSSVKRALQTAQIIKDKANIPYKEEPGLADWNIGDLASKPSAAFDEKYFVNHSTEKVGGGESFDDFVNRVAATIEKIHPDESNFAILTHSKVIKLIQSLQATNGIYNNTTKKEYNKDEAPYNSQTREVGIFSRKGISKDVNALGEPSLKKDEGGYCFKNGEKERYLDMYQIAETEGSKSSPATLKRVEEFLQRIGVNTKQVKDIRDVNNNILNANAKADILNKLIEVVGGKENVAMTEEAMHYAIEILEQTDSKLFNLMLNRIGKYQVFSDVANSDTYKKLYGANNIRALKKEAMGKVLAEYVIQQNEGSTEKPELLAQVQGWWEQIKEFFKKLFMKAEFDPFQTVAKKVLTGESIGTMEDVNISPQAISLADRIKVKKGGGWLGSLIKEKIEEGNNLEAISILYQQLEDKGGGTIGGLENPGTYQSVIDNILEADKKLGDDILTFGGSYFQVGTDKQDGIYNSILAQHNKIVKVEPADSDSYYQVNDKRVKNRVTDIAKRFYERTFGNKEIEKTDYQKAIDDIKKENGTAGHADLENSFHTLVDERGFIRQSPLDDSNYISRINPKDGGVYELLKKNLSDRMATFPDKTRFLSEVKVYDPRRDEAGTMDFVAITPEGKVSILDWKFMELNTQKFEDVPWYKVKAWRLQIGEYKRVLKDVYNVPAEDFQQTRAIPIQAEYKYGDYTKKELPTLTGIKIGDINVKNEPNNYLLPVGLEEETTGNEDLDKLIAKLNSVYDKLSDKKAAEGERRQKAEQLNSLYSAIRQLHMRTEVKPLIGQAKVLNKRIDSIIERYEKAYKDKPASDFSNRELSDFANELSDASDIIQVYSNLDTDLGFLFENDELSPDEQELQSDLTKTGNAARVRARKLETVSDKFADQKIAGKVGVKEILSPERVVKGIQKIFASTSEIPLKTLNALYKLRNEAKQLTDIENSEENTKLEHMKEAYDAMAKSKGLTAKTYFDLIKKGDKNQLIDEFDKDFYKTLKSKIQDKDFDWVRDNVDTVEFKKYMKEQLTNELQRIQDRHYSGTDDEIAEEMTKAKIKAEKEFSTADSDSLGWYNYIALRKFPVRAKWESKEYKELGKSENKAALDFYNYIKDRNNYYRDLGYIDSKYARNFLPFIPKSFTEKLVFGGDKRLFEGLLRAVSIDEGTVGYGQVDPLTGKILDTIPKYFTNEITGNASTDLFRNISLYNEAAIRYKYLSEIEGQARALARVERNKGSIITSFFGKAQWNPTTGQLDLSPSNEENSKLVDDTIKAIIYGQRYINNENFDQVLGKVGTWGSKINDKLGYKIFPEHLEGRNISMNKTIDGVNRFFQMKIFGFNLLSPLSNLFGGTVQTIMNSGKYFKPSEFEAAVLRLTASKFSGEDGKKVFAAIDYFLPLTENSNRHAAKQLSISKISHEGIQDFLMGLMRKSDDAVQYSIFLATLDNTAVIDGKLVNAREYMRNTPEWRERYSLPSVDRKALEVKFDKDVKELLKDKAVMKLAEIKDDKFHIPGVDRKSESVFDVRRISQRLSKDALGNLTEDEVRKINLTVYGKSMMMFKNWIPRLVDVRFAQLKYNSASDAYEWGRTRTVMRIIMTDTIHALSNLANSLKANEKGVEYMRELFAKKSAEYYKSTGKKLEMTEDQFFDMTRQNIKSQMRDALFYLAVMGVYLAAKALPPDKDEDPEVKSSYRFMLRAVDKLSDEVGFFYNPLSFQQILNGSIFPSLGVVTDGARVIEHFGGYMFDLTFDREEALKTDHPLKFLMKTFPIANQLSGYLPMFFPDMAKSLGIQVSAQSRLH